MLKIVAIVLTVVQLLAFVPGDFQNPEMEKKISSNQYFH